MQAQSTLEGSRQGILILAALAAANILAVTRGPQEIYCQAYIYDPLWVESDFEFAPRNLWTSRDLKFSINYERYMIG